ncbi:hypothetical protein L7F22_069449 [Adiantum nelumboides]|nr:hypothetical protein [Adiantum nelumboides]
MGVSGLVFGNNEQKSQEEDGGVERLLERIKNGVLAEDRRRAMEELQDAVAESRSAQLALGATGLPIILSILREERGNLDLVRGGLETLVNALGFEGDLNGNRGPVQPGMLNSELLAREEGSASLLLSLLDEEDFYVRYHTLCLLTMLSRNSAVWLQEAVLATPQGLTRLMDMMQDREVIRNEALLLLTFLTRSAKEIQKIAVFEGVFEKLFNIIIEEGGCDGGIVVQDCLDLLNNVLRDSSANQNFLRETLGLHPVGLLLKLRKGSNLSFSQQKTMNLLCILETVTLLLARDPAKEVLEDANALANQSVLMQNNVLDYLLIHSVEEKAPAVAVRCASLKCIGDLIRHNARNAEILGKRTVGEEPDEEPALNAVLRLMLHTSDKDERAAAEYVIKCFCEVNPEGQLILARLPLGSMLFHALDISKGKKDCLESRNAALTEELGNETNRGSQGERSGQTVKERVQMYQHILENMEKEQQEKEQEVMYYKQLAEKHEEDLKSLSAAYNSLKQENHHLDLQVKGLSKGIEGTAIAGPSVSELEAAREEGRKEAAKESETELNDLLVCLGQEESKVERLRARLEELGEDVEALIQGIGEEPERGLNGEEE